MRPPSAAARQLKYALLAVLLALAPLARSTAAPAEETIPFEPYRNLIFLPVSVNGSKPLSFILDSGSGTCMIDKARARDLGLKTQPGGRAVGAGEGTFEYELTRDVSFSNGRVDFAVDAVRVADLASLRLVFGRPVDGILGYEAFDRYVVRVDYEKRILTFSDAATYRYVGRGEKLPLSITNNVPYVEAQLKMPGHEPVTRRFLIDTGMASSAVTDEFIAFTTSTKLETVVGVGLGRERQGVAARIEKLQLGSYVIEKAIGQTGTGKSVIGGPILSRFNVVFDYAQHQLILEPNAAFAEPYLYDASGLGLRLTADLKHFRVHSLLPDSPAAEAGLRRDDLITAIDGRPAAEYDLTDVQHRLFKQRGKQHRLDIQRGDQQFQVSITLRKLL